MSITQSALLGIELASFWLQVKIVTSELNLPDNYDLHKQI